MCGQSGAGCVRAGGGGRAHQALSHSRKRSGLRDVLCTHTHTHTHVDLSIPVYILPFSLLLSCVTPLLCVENTATKDTLVYPHLSLLQQASMILKVHFRN